MSDVIEFAKERYEYCCQHDLYEDARYWSAYLDGAKAYAAEVRKCD